MLKKLINKIPSPVIHIGLFLLTLFATTMAGSEHLNFHGVKFFENGELTDQVGFYLSGLWYSIPFLGILTAHEFGHYFLAKYHRLKVTLPYYIPFWLPGSGFPMIGTMGAVIRLKTPSYSTKQFFDVGIAGPLAGFVVAMGFITYGFMTLPPREAIFEIHPSYYHDFEQHGVDYETKAYSEEGFSEVLIEAEKHGYTDGYPLFSIGDNLIFWLFENYLVSDKSRVPNHYELMHYPFLFAGFMALVFTALNLLPIGQLDGGHVLFGLVGEKKHLFISKWGLTGFILYAGLGLEYLSLVQNDVQTVLFNSVLYVLFLNLVFDKVFLQKINKWTVISTVFSFQFIIGYFFPQLVGYSGWLLFGLIVGRFLGVYHPPVLIEQPLDVKRKILGWASLLIFILCVTPQPMILEMVGAK